MRLALNFGHKRHIQSACITPRAVEDKTAFEKQQLPKPQSCPLISYDKKDKKNTTDLIAFKEKEQISDTEPPIDCFKLMTYQQSTFFISLNELNNIDFPVMSYTIS